MEEKQDDQKEHEKIATDESVSYGTLDNDSEIPTKKDVRIVCLIILSVARVTYSHMPDCFEKNENFVEWMDILVWY